MSDCWWCCAWLGLVAACSSDNKLRIVLDGERVFVVAIGIEQLELVVILLLRFRHDGRGLAHVGRRPDPFRGHARRSRCRRAAPGVDVGRASTATCTASRSSSATRVIVATTGNSVYAFDAATGKTKWQQLEVGHADRRIDTAVRQREPGRHHEHAGRRSREQPACTSSA